MEDAQFPPDAGDANTSPAHRSSLRLSEAEAVATTRLDMFGDGSLKQALAASAHSAEDGEDGSAAMPTASPMDLPLPDGGVAYGNQPAPPDLSTPGPEPRPPLPLPTFRHSFEAATDLAPAEHAGREHTDHDASPVPPPPEDLRQEPDPAMDAPAAAARDVGDPGALGPIAEAEEPAPAADIEVSPIFSALDAVEQRAEEVEPREPAAPPTLLGPPMLMPPGSQEQDGSADAGPLSERPQFRDELIRGPAGSGTVGDTEPPVAEPEAEVIAYPELPEVPAYPQVAEAPPPEPPPDFPLPAPPADPVFPELQSPPTPQPFDDAAARIAAEANATAEALENLQRLLVHTLPELERAASAGSGEHMAGPPPVLGPPPLQMRVEPPHFATGVTAPLLPLPVPPARSGGRSVYLLGFLTGLGLSLMAGAALYFFILTNGG
jgi:hypothetical protein